ncbi:hypothetical protein [Clostridioides difficile]|uniref:hypothetical protein n=1 Tax=Clostridioides difficile TaxID=1496 RepID=UPI001F27BCFD|nr:hypothetical protein [Clostridioides difficile]MCP8493626.1 hypothetical protein [Clostridioides difficile]MCP8656642.1 hypothetical protein [Clostridioides difficile]MCP8663656.1 hypothetical protein [Clostridioides difficile]
MGVRNIKIVFEGVPASFRVKHGDALAVFVYPTLKQLVPYLYGGNGNRIGALGVNQELFIKAAFIITAGRGQKVLPCLRVSRNRSACTLIQLGN